MLLLHRQYWLLLIQLIYHHILLWLPLLLSSKCWLLRGSQNLLLRDGWLRTGVLPEGWKLTILAYIVLVLSSFHDSCDLF